MLRWRSCQGRPQGTHRPLPSHAVHLRPFDCLLSSVYTRNLMDADAPSTKRARKQSERLDSSSTQSKIRPPSKVSYKPQVFAPKVDHPIERKILPSVALSHVDKASQLRLSEDQLVCYGCDGGYRMVRATHGVQTGGYYWEAEVLSAGPNGDGHVRLGWSTRAGELQAPVGYDEHSFGYRDTAGSYVHDSVRVDGVADSFGVGDIAGCYLFLHPTDASENKIHFFKNGRNQGVAFSGREVPTQVYFPALSLFREAAVRVNFGPSFIVKPELVGQQCLPVSELQPFSVEDRKEHDAQVLAIRREREERIREVKNTIVDAVDTVPVQSTPDAVSADKT